MKSQSSQRRFTEEFKEQAVRQVTDQGAESDVRLSVTPTSSTRLPPTEFPCFTISRITLQGDAAERFNWALDAANIANDSASDDPAIGRCLGTVGINTVMTRIQNAIVARGFVTTRILAGRTLAGAAARKGPGGMCSSARHCINPKPSRPNPPPPGFSWVGVIDNPIVGSGVTHTHPPAHRGV